jgi:heme/copper-type cytochrome/quinol oxidase subunit 2
VNRPKRVAIVSAVFAIAIGLIVFTAMAFIRSSPPAVNFAAQPGEPVDLTIQTVGTIGFGVHPSWVSYLVKSPSGQWTHTTLWKLPAHTTVDVTLLQYDSGSPLRNQEAGSVLGVQNATLNGAPFTLVNSYAGNGLAHTFSVPELNVNVPLPGIDPNAKNACGAAPCDLGEAHNTVTFSFNSGAPGMYRWQCFIPCGLGFLYGNGGPMQTIGYMGGFLEVS